MTGPYIVTTNRSCSYCWGGRPKWAGTMPASPCTECSGTGKVALSRVAVATLEEAQIHVTTWITDRWSSHPHFAKADGDRYKPETRPMVAQAATLPESGGTIGPLPDGTVIEVEQATYPDIAMLGEFTDSEMRTLANTEQALLDAFNAREAKQRAEFERRKQPDVVAARPCPVYIVIDRISGERVYTESSSRHVYRIYCEQEGDHGTHVGDRSQSEFDRLMKAWKKQQR
jgi:hypothetical protein